MRHKRIKETANNTVDKYFKIWAKSLWFSIFSFRFFHFFYKRTSNLMTSILISIRSILSLLTVLSILLLLVVLLSIVLLSIVWVVSLLVWSSCGFSIVGWLCLEFAIIETSVPVFVEFQAWWTSDTSDSNSLPAGNILVWIAWIYNVSTEMWTTVGTFIRAFECGSWMPLFSCSTFVMFAV